MQLSTDLAPNSDFTRILNTVIFDDSLTHAEFRLWCRLLALPKGADQVSVSIAAIAKELGVSTTNFRNQRKALEDKGYLSSKGGKVLITIPDEDFQPKEVKLTKEQQLRHDLRDIWNKHKPEIYSKQKHPISVAQLETLQLQAEHNNQKDLPLFLAAVLTGAKADDWWGVNKMNFDMIFGTGEPKQKKFNNVEKLLNLSTSRKAKAVTFDVDDDQCWIDWFHSKGATEFTKVERCKAPERIEAFLHNQDNPSAPGTIRVYQTETGFPCFWTKDSDPRFVPHQLPSRA